MIFALSHFGWRGSQPTLRSSLIVLAFLFSSRLIAQKRMFPISKDSKVSFTIKNFGLPVEGSLGGIRGEIIFEPATLSTSRFEVSVQSASINTGNKMRDEHLRKADYLNVAEFREIQFRSISITPSGQNAGFTMTGMLTIKGNSKKLTFPFTAENIPGGYRFSGSFRINRRDFDVGGSSISLNDYLTISLMVTAIETP